MSDLIPLIQQLLVEVRRLNEVKTASTREVLSIPEAAEYLGMAESTVQKWVKMRKIPFFRINGTIKFRKSRLDRWINIGEAPVIE
jgi:excisionase family DNA binding protein